jgi:TubC N-terminal docking domain
MDPDLRLPRLLQELDDRRVRLRLENGQLHVEHGDKLTAELCDEVSELRAELVAYLRTDGEEVLDDPEERSRQGNNTPPAPELSRDDKLATSLKASKRMYMNGEVLVNHPNNMGAFMRRLREQDERRQAAERGELPPQGRYRTRFDIFG